MTCTHKHIYNTTSGEKSNTVTLAMNWCSGFTKYGVIRIMGVAIFVAAHYFNCVNKSLFKKVTHHPIDSQKDPSINNLACTES